MLSADSGGFSGMTEVLGGRLVVNGTLGGLLSVHDGAMLGGSGTVGTTTIAAGATVAPGNSIGTLTVAGNYFQAVGSRYEVEIDGAGNSDLIDVGGTAQLDGGTVQVTLLRGAVSAGTPYTVLTAAGGLSGAFATLETSIGSTLFLTPA